MDDLHGPARSHHMSDESANQSHEASPPIWGGAHPERPHPVRNSHVYSQAAFSTTIDESFVTPTPAIVILSADASTAILVGTTGTSRGPPLEAVGATFRLDVADCC